jgi:ribosomal-protein-alanine N-acetyltransferase
VSAPATSIRPLGPFDLQLLAALHEMCFTAPWDQAWSATSFAEILAMPGAGGWLISRDVQPLDEQTPGEQAPSEQAPSEQAPSEQALGEQPRGFILTRHVLDEMEIILVAIDPEYRRLGLAGRLLQAALQDAAGKGIRTVFLEQAAPNLAAHQLYVRHGFADVGRRRGYYRGRTGEMADALILRRDLSAS